MIFSAPGLKHILRKLNILGQRQIIQPVPVVSDCLGHFVPIYYWSITLTVQSATFECCLFPSGLQKVPPVKGQLSRPIVREFLPPRCWSWGASLHPRLQDSLCYFQFVRDPIPALEVMISITKGHLQCTLNSRVQSVSCPLYTLCTLQEYTVFLLLFFCQCFVSTLSHRFSSGIGKEQADHVGTCRPETENVQKILLEPAVGPELVVFIL